MEAASYITNIEETEKFLTDNGVHFTVSYIF